MIQRMETLTRLTQTEALNSWREPVKTWGEAGTVRAALSAGTGALKAANELLRIESTHSGVTYDDVRVGDRLRDADGGEYAVTWTVPGRGRRMTQLYLQKVEARDAGDD